MGLGFSSLGREKEREIEIEDGEEKVRLSPGWWWLALSDEDH